MFDEVYSSFQKFQPFYAWKYILQLFVSYLIYRHGHLVSFGKSDLYFTCTLQPLSEDILIEDCEIEAAKVCCGDVVLLQTIFYIVINKLLCAYSGSHWRSFKAKISSQRASHEGRCWNFVSPVLMVDIEVLKQSNCLVDPLLVLHVTSSLISYHPLLWYTCTLSLSIYNEWLQFDQPDLEFSKNKIGLKFSRENRSCVA